VFDGSQAPYLPGYEANQLNFYGKSKLLGEEVIKKELSHYAILRVPVLYGKVEYPGESAVITLIQSVIKKESTVQDHWSARYPTYVNDIAVALKDFAPLFKNDVSLSATYHFSGNEEVTKFEICQIMAEILGVSGDHISANSSTPAGAPRPQDCHLDDSSLASIISLQKTPFREALAEVISSMKSKDLI
ncbi:MAG: sugar nucleotide-binding protein, partial [Lentisphaeraceae bacterium]|nr:sugar nucleotide-binding protein [Lentisphaeraceae bacterium]